MIAEMASKRFFVAEEMRDRLNNGYTVSGEKFRKSHITDSALIIENGPWNFEIPLGRLLEMDFNPVNMTHTFTFEDGSRRPTEATFFTKKVGFKLIPKKP